ncbi:MAG TPA: type II toxin-antitoxin system VapC family toxin [Terriglobia bacterium]|nr:type II toxin-antitoxin system VapC family toxin [Terriglobia bacterium]
MKLVLDASVAGKWLVPETDSDRARWIFERWNRGQIELIAPALLVAEIASMLWKRATRGLISTEESIHLFQEFFKLGLGLTPIETLATVALELSILHGHPFYDCLYVALAIENRCGLLTADEKLFHSFHPQLPQVRLLKSLEIEG